MSYNLERREPRRQCKISIADPPTPVKVQRQRDY